MKKQLEQFFGDATTVQLTDDEKAVVRSRLSAYVQLMPVRTAERPSRRRGLASAVAGRAVPVFGIVLTLAFSLAGVSYAAEDAIPGDRLYSFKVGVNEGVRTALAVTPRARAEWESTRAMRRLQEAETLFLDGEPAANTTRVSSIAGNFVRHAAQVEARVADFEDADNFDAVADVATHFETSLIVHEQILVNLANTIDADRAGAAEIALAVEQQRKTTAERRAKFDERVRTDPEKVKAAAQARMRAAGRHIEAAAKAAAKFRNRAVGGGAAQFDAQLAVAQQAYARGEAEAEAGKFDAAFLEFDRAQRLAAESHVLLDTHRQFRDKVRFTVDGQASTDAPVQVTPVVMPPPDAVLINAQNNVGVGL